MQIIVAVKYACAAVLPQGSEVRQPSYCLTSGTHYYTQALQNTNYSTVLYECLHSARGQRCGRRACIQLICKMARPSASCTLCKDISVW